MGKIKNVMAIHDISGIGKCSLTVVLPILSVMGIETSVIPTSVFSTHTGGLGSPTIIDLTNNLISYVKHWESLNVEFDSIYSGYLGSINQVNIIREVIERFKKENTIFLLDPVMADNGKLYNRFDLNFVNEMKVLCKYADIITPNITEAILLLNKNYMEGPYSKKFINELLSDLSKLGPKKIVLTGVSFDERNIGVITLDSDIRDINYIIAERIEGNYHGVGDIFGSILIGGLLNKLNLNEACKLAIDFIVESIKVTMDNNLCEKFGLYFEKNLYKLGRYIEK